MSRARVIRSTAVLYLLLVAGARAEAPAGSDGAPSEAVETARSSALETLEGAPQPEGLRSLPQPASQEQQQDRVAATADLGEHRDLSEPFDLGLPVNPVESFSGDGADWSCAEACSLDPGDFCIDYSSNAECRSDCRAQCRDWANGFGFCNQTTCCCYVP